MKFLKRAWFCFLGPFIFIIGTPIVMWTYFVDVCKGRYDYHSHFPWDPDMPPRSPAEKLVEESKPLFW